MQSQCRGHFLLGYLCLKTRLEIFVLRNIVNHPAHLSKNTHRHHLTLVMEQNPNLVRHIFKHVLKKIRLIRNNHRFDCPP